MRLLPALGLALAFLPGCGSLCSILDCTPNPQPTPTPTPTPTPKPIPPEAEQCHLKTPPATHSCYDNPPGGQSFDQWEPNWGYVCALPTGGTSRVAVPEDCPAAPPLPEPQCPAGRLAESSATVTLEASACDCYEGHEWRPCTPTGCGFPQGVDNQLEARPHTNRFRPEINEVMSKLSGCPINTDCPIPYGPDEWMEMVNAELCKLGLHAGRHRNTPGQQATDQISVSDRPWCEAQHTNQQIYNFGATSKVRWNSTGGSFDDWQFKPGAPYCDSGPPPPADTCPAPVPPKINRWSQGTPKPHGPWFDSTPLFYDGLSSNWDGSVQEGYCRATGQDRLHCPARPEGHEDRLACERWGVSGQKHGAPLWRSDGSTEVKADNIFQGRCTSCTWLEVCAADGTVCARRELQ
jgi:hypothetical protein